jgi:DNA recombination protein RmuC
MILENILESSGLEKDRNYFTQQSYSTGEGRRLQPDVMIKLPENKWVVIDSKVSLNAYERFVNETDETLKSDALKAHMLSIRQHFKGLSGKGYNELADGKNLDFILMFVPIEPAYLIALHGDQSLFNEAFEKGIVMVSPSTLIASLKIIASTWKHEYQNRNALDIANRGKLLLEKFIGFTEDFLKIGEQLSRSDKAYQDALKKLRDGKGSLVTQAMQLEELGVKTSKKIDSNLTQDEA